MPRLRCFDHAQPTDGAIDSMAFEVRARRALDRCLASPPGRDAEALLETFAEIEVSVISDEAIARVHGEFFDDPTATDVITFPHGEILVSVDTAQREAPRYAHATERELLLYVIHGLLHLHGYDDREATSRERMKGVEAELLDEVWPLP